ncbi:unnamed protein product [marine sediment metagenome]|uniref:Uncharacterized protein n=1 Tax=marine sediment metagenome TaxID=412755 RepID=X1S1X8_9ZZZZ
MERNINKLYVGIDIHSRQHKVALISTDDFSKVSPNWRRARLLTIKNNAEDFNLLTKEIETLVPNPEDVAIAIDHTGGHYSMPLVWFLQSRG